MRSTVVIGALFAVGLAIGAGSLLRRTAERSSDHLAPDPDAAAPEAPPPGAQQAPVASSTTAGVAALEALRAMSETYRNTTLLIAIRDDGFVCEEVTDAVEGSDATGWLARCRDLRVYHVGVAGNGDLEAEPVPAYFDQVALPTFDRESPPIDVPLEAPSPPR